MYIDTSAAVKLYTSEPDSEPCQSIAAGQSLVSSELLYCELRSAFLAKERAGIISKDQRGLAWETFERDLAENRVHLFAISGVVVREASEIMIEVHPEVPLRSLDAIHLATYFGVESGPLFTRDKRMLEAARRLQVPLAG